MIKPPKLLWLCGLSFCLMTVEPSAKAETLGSFWSNNKGLYHLKKKSNAQAYRDFLEALESEPMNPEVQMNLGYTWQQNEEFEKAASAYRGVLKIVPENSERRFEALFNLGIVETKLEKVEQAAQAYQQALEIHPDSIEVKTNLELLFQQSQGGGKGKSKDKDKKEGKGDKDQEQNRDQQQNEPKDPQEKKKQQPKPFDSKDLSKEDVKRILDEIKNQEQGVRAQEYERKGKEGPRGKDW